MGARVPLLGSRPGFGMGLETGLGYTATFFPIHLDAIEIYIAAVGAVT